MTLTERHAMVSVACPMCESPKGIPCHQITAEGKRTARALRGVHPGRLSAFKAEVTGECTIVTGEEFGQLVDGLPPAARCLFEGAFKMLTERQLRRDLKQLNHPEVPLAEKLATVDEIHALRREMCRIVGVQPQGNDDKDEAADTYAVARWERAGWPGWEA